MEPIAVEGTSPEYTLVHRCIRCGFEKRNRVVPGDEPEQVIAIAKKRAARDNHA
jgi:hypothetical protein